jgi:GNAT superfamily N-acetyltransferase
MMISIIRIENLPIDELLQLLEESKRMGFRFVEQLIAEWESGDNRFDKDGEALFIAREDKKVVGICGINIDPYLNNPQVGRVRHLYVIAEERRKGIGRELVQRVIEEARKHFSYLRLRAVNEDSYRFYSALGFSSVYGDNNCTHVFDLKFLTLQKRNKP